MNKRIVVLGSGGVDRKKIVPDISPLLDQLPPGDDQRLIYVTRRRSDIMDDLSAGKIEPYMKEMGSNPAVWMRYLCNTIYSRHFGGKGSNTVYAAAKLGADVHFYGAFGNVNDIDSTEHIQHLTDAGAKVDVQRIEGETLSQAFIYANHHGQQVSLVYRGANKHADQSRVPDEKLDANTILVIQTSVPVKQSMALAERAKQRGACVVFNCTKVDDVLLEHFKLIDELVVNLDEATNIAKKFNIAHATPEHMAAELAKELGVICVITRGGKSVIYAEEIDGRVIVNDVTTPTIKPRDVTGAGDALLGSYVAFRAQGQSVGGALELGVVAGAFTAKHEGATHPALGRAVMRATRRKIPTRKANLG